MSSFELSFCGSTPFLKRKQQWTNIEKKFELWTSATKVFVFNNLFAFSGKSWNYSQPLAFGAQGLQRGVVWYSEDITIKDKPLSSLKINYEWWCYLFHWNKDVDKPARLIFILLLGFVSESVYSKLNQNINKYRDGNDVFKVASPQIKGIQYRSNILYPSQNSHIERNGKKSNLQLDNVSS